MKNKLITIAYAVAIFFFIISFSIGLPIYCRFFYYLQINTLNLPESTGYSYAQIKQAYDQVLNYLTLPGGTFKSGVFSMSADGISHFVDCKILFSINLIALLISTCILVTTLILVKFKKVTLLRPCGYDASFFSSISIFVVFALIFGLASINFDKAFTIFHKIFFPGKDNWQFGYEDQIINILPQEFFMNCAILIGVSILAISLTIIVFQIIKKRKLKNN